jgi:hypothetical protein
VEGCRITASLLIRLGATRSAKTPSIRRFPGGQLRSSAPRTFHDQQLLLTASDSAVTAPRPPGLVSFAKVTSRWAIRMNSSRMNANFNGL